MGRILAPNPGATSPKFALLDDEQAILQRSLEHHGTELQGFTRICDQAEYRMGLMLAELKVASIPLKCLHAVVGRGGLLNPLVGGAYRVNNAMLADLKEAARARTPI